jgi:hypothetical protein
LPAAGAIGKAAELEALLSVCDKGCIEAEVCGAHAEGCSEVEENTCFVAFVAISRVDWACAVIVDWSVEGARVDAEGAKEAEEPTRGAWGLLAGRRVESMTSNGRDPHRDRLK